ncbi:hypothetical protein TNCV_2612661 [Trichonephila clavipes]|nr:hypothetical protein TNCV_2612661 [Trichonephila clavipes]
MIAQWYVQLHRTVTTLCCSARSPDSSPIKHIWDQLGRRVGHPMSLNELEASDSQNGLFGPPGDYDDLQGVHVSEKITWESMRCK